MNRQKINLIGGGFQHASSSTDNSETQYIEWLKESNMAPISIYVDQGLFVEPNKNTKNYGWLSESKTIVGNGIYNWLKENVELLKKRYITIFTYDVELVNFSNYFTLTQCSVKSIITEPKIYDKTKLISMVASNKRFCQEHIYRQEIVQKFKNKLDLYGRGYNPIMNKIDGLKDYCFSIAMENATYPNMMTEKITDCFATGTIPVYYGIPNIGDFFNIDGIILLDDNFKIEDLSIDLYYSKMDAIKENFEITKNLLLAEDYIYVNYIKNNLLNI